MCQGNVEVTAAHPFVLCDSHIDYFLLAENNELNVQYSHLFVTVKDESILNLLRRVNYITGICHK